MLSRLALFFRLIAFRSVITTFKAVKTMSIKISALIGINDCILAVYYCKDSLYRFSVVNTMGRTYTSNEQFLTLSSAKLLAISVTEKLAIDRDRR